MGYKYNPLLKVGLDEVGAGGSASAAGSDTEIQYNSSGTFAASADLTWDDTAKELGVGGDINLDDGGTFATTLQLITPTANRTISFPDATGTVGLVGGSSGQLVYNNAGAYAGAPSTSVGATGNITLSLAGAASTPPVSLTGTWFSGGTSTTTKPQLLIEPTGTTSTAWSTSGTGLGVNAASGFGGRLFDFQINGSSKAVLDSFGRLLVGTSSARANFFNNASDTALQLEGTGGNARMSLVSCFNSITASADIVLAKQRSGSVGGNTIVSSGDVIGSLSYQGSDGSDFVEAAIIRCQVDGTPGANDMPGRLVFSTTADGASSPTERMRIKSNGTINFSNVSVYADNTAALAGGLVAGDVYRKSDGTLMITY